MQQIKAKNACPDTKSLINKNSLGGHMEDYISRDKTPLPKNLRWVPVSESFKKS